MRPRLQGIPTAIITSEDLPPERDTKASREVLYSADPAEEEEKRAPGAERAITGFYGYFSFLGLCERASVFYEDRMYTSAAHAFEAARAPDEAARSLIIKAPTLDDMLEMAATNPDPPNWDVRRLVVMEAIQRDKFKRNAELREKLVATGTRGLIHQVRNNKRDPTARESAFWGKKRGKRGNLEGQNQLGRILEQVRADIAAGSDLEQWVGVAFGLEEETTHIPVVTVDVFKESKLIEQVRFEKKPIFILGCQAGKVDYQIAHPSLSRQHAVLFTRRAGKGVFLVDIGSKAGTFINGEKLRPFEPQRLAEGNKVNFGASTRDYKVSIDFSRIELLLQQEKKAMERELALMKHLDGAKGSAAIKEALDMAREDTVFVGGLPSGVD